MYFEFEENSGGFLTKIGYKEQRIIDKPAKKINDELNDELNDGQQKVMTYIKHHQGLMAKDISDLLKMPFGTVDRHIRVLLKKNLIARKGSKKTGGYWIIDKTKDS